MSVRKRKWITRNGEAKEAWIVDYTDQQGDRHIETFARKKEADAYAQQVGVDVRTGTHTPVSKSITVAQAAEDWITSVGLEGREAATLVQYRQHARHIGKRIGNVKLAALTTPRINLFRDDLLATMSRAMARKVMSSLKSLLRDAQRRGNVAQNVALGVKRIDADKRREGRLKVGVDIPTADEIKAIINAAGPRKPLLMTAAFTGLRGSELRGLRWEAVDLKGGELHVRQRADRYNVMGEPKSRAGHRAVPLGPLVLNALREWRLVCPRGELGLVFPTADGGVASHNDLRRALETAARTAGLTGPDGEPKFAGLHALRHFYASWCIDPPDRGGQGLPPKVVQERLGHSSIVMTMDTYGHLFPAGDDASRRLADAERALLG
ncbi:MAG TPA: site-specific integrase [Casimicrobiaceae bacterium]|jgi:integrase|nr:site-specific integrase [Casimicrobiaceae bacterium]